MGTHLRNYLVGFMTSVIPTDVRFQAENMFAVMPEPPQSFPWS